jgi:acyl-CoA thioesterase
MAAIRMNKRSTFVAILIESGTNQLLLVMMMPSKTLVAESRVKVTTIVDHTFLYFISWFHQDVSVNYWTYSESNKKLHSEFQLC